MKKLNIVKKILSFVTCSVLSVTLIAISPSLSNSRTPEISAMTLAEIQEERQANQDKIKELEQKITSLEGNIDSEKEVQEYLSDQIDLIKQNITFINAELDSINNDISNTQKNIDELDRSIIEQQAQIDESIEIFKSRLSEMYITGNENLASIILGSSSFYDVMSRVEMANRMAAYDEELINGLLSDIDNLEQSKKGLETERLTLEMKLDEQERKKEERAADLAVLDEKMEKTQEEIDRIERERQLFEEDLDALKSRDESLKAEENNIIETIRREEERRK